MDPLYATLAAARRRCDDDNCADEACLEGQECSVPARASGAGAVPPPGAAAAAASAADHPAAMFKAGISGPPGDDVEVDLAAAKTAKRKYSELIERRIQEVKAGVDKGEIKLSPADWKVPPKHNQGFRPDPADYHLRVIGVWDPESIFPGREFRCSRCEGGTMRVRDWCDKARPVFSLDGSYWWLLTKNMICNKCGSKTRATSDDFLKGMDVYDRAAFKVYLGYQSSVDSEMAEYLWAHFGSMSMDDIAAKFKGRAMDRYVSAVAVSVVAAAVLVVVVLLLLLVHARVLLLPPLPPLLLRAPTTAAPQTNTH